MDWGCRLCLSSEDSAIGSSFALKTATPARCSRLLNCSTTRLSSLKRSLVEPQLDKGSLKELKRVVERFSSREHLAGVAVFNAKLEPIAESSQLRQSLQSQSIAVPQAIVQNKKQSQFVHLAQRVRAHLCVAPSPGGSSCG